MRAPSIAVLVVAAGLLVTAATPAAQVSQERILKLSFDADGLVTLRAQNVSAKDVLAEWRRQCECTIVDADKLTGTPMQMPLAFEKATQAVVLDTLLRQAAGVILTPRRAGATGPSNYETIYVLATSNPVASPYSSSYSSPVQAPYQSNLATPGSPSDEIPPVTPIPGQVPQAQPGINNAPRSPATSYTPGVLNLPGPGPMGAPGAAGPGASPGPVFVPITPIGTSPKPAGGGAPAPLGGRGGGGGQ